MSAPDPRVTTPQLGTAGIVRLGVVQFALGALVVLATTTLNRIMVVELALPAIVPGLLIGLHYAVQVLRPRWGFGADRSASDGRWIFGGMAILAGGVVLAGFATALAARHAPAGLALAVLAYAAIGLGVGGAGTSLLTLLARSVAPAARARAATIVWLMMIAGSAIAAVVAGRLLVPFSFDRLIAVLSGAATLALGVTAVAVWRMARFPALISTAPARDFGSTWRQVWSDATARRFALFVFVSMLAYGGQELVLEPFAGLVFGLHPGGSTGLTGLQHGGVLIGMLLVGAAGGRIAGTRLWTIGGCVGSAAALLALAACGLAGPAGLLRPCVFALGLANGAFAVSAIGAMMQLAAARPRAEAAGTRMGLFGAAQAIAFGLGGVASSGGSDVARRLAGSPVDAYAIVFVAEAALFCWAAMLAATIFDAAARTGRAPHAVGSTP